ncbi:hypothetical protein [Peribacillus asahii]|uniref:hypothetical protein n=1 Tax=Peribacillus asahii TaxID=228899 RepID=UPI00207A4D00|nr:hypothetical protein [Peribacillus asahii]USK87126.1 hypothetical protein LIT35_11100 [Peribacillus asahii]
MRVIQGVCLSEDEQVIKKYKASIVGPQHFLSMLAPNTQLGKPKSSTIGYLIVTTHRIIFVGETKVNEFFTIRDVSIDKVTGVISYIGKKVNIFKVLGGLFLLPIGLIISYLLTTVSDSFISILATILFIGWPVYLIYSGMVKKYTQIDLRIMASNDGNSAVGVSADINLGLFARILYVIFKADREKAWMAVDAADTSTDTQKLMRELGALVRDVQNLGHQAVAKWQDKNVLKEIIDTDADASKDVHQPEKILSTSQMETPQQNIFQ